MIRSLAFSVLIAATLASTAFAQGRGNSGLPPASGNPLAALQQQIDALTARVAALQGGNGGVQSVEPNLVVVRGSVPGAIGGTFQGPGFTAVETSFGTYEVTFDQSFSSPPTVVVAIHGFFTAPPPDQQFVQTIAIDDPNGGISTGGFHAYIAQPSNDPNSKGSFGSQNWEFIAIGSR